MEFQTLVDAFAAFGWQGLLFAAVILVGVFVAKKVKLVVTGDQARLANLVLGAILAGLSDNPQAESALLAVLSSLLAALMFELLKYTGAQFSKG